jgi:hypothetical protein
VYAFAPARCLISLDSITRILGLTAEVLGALYYEPTSGGNVSATIAGCDRLSSQTAAPERPGAQTLPKARWAIGKGGKLKAHKLRARRGAGTPADCVMTVPICPTRQSAMSLCSPDLSKPPTHAGVHVDRPSIGSNLSENVVRARECCESLGAISVFRRAPSSSNQAEIKAHAPAATPLRACAGEALPRILKSRYSLNR